ncbi:MAG: uroporphyrinogen-III C-methyltransferase [Acidobacteria bacterium]|nr:MAG: uroporphyrinogen-III C-methyltransferase [Acidobacteriota bacterium]
MGTPPVGAVMLPVMLDLRDRACLVVGGGEVGVRKAEGLLEAGALVTVVAPSPAAAVEALAACGRLRLERRPYRAGEAAGYRLVFTATDSAETNRRVAADAEAAGIWANVADEPELCTFHVPARVRRGALQIAIASNGEAPFAVRRLRQLLDRRLAGDWAAWIAAAARFRPRVRALAAPAQREALFDRFFAATVDPDSLTARVPAPEEEAAWLANAAAVKAPVPTDPPRRPGFVSLVGAGPGDPGLLTVRARRRLMTADAVVFDRLAEPVLPPDLPARVELHSVGKEAGHHPVPQGEINALLVRLGLEGKRVVRLKGGDPYVFGRGGEEAEDLRAAGVPFEVVPGVTAGIAAPACAGIPVTSRDEAVRVTLVTAHESTRVDGSFVHWDQLAHDPHATIVAYMAVSSLKQVSANLLAGGMDPEFPAAMIERGTTSAQRVVRAPIRELPAAAEAAGIQPPALLVVGPTVHHAESLAAFTRRPLFGERLALAAPAGDVRDALEEAGAEVVEAPLPLTPAARIVLRALPLTGCLLRSPADAVAFADERPAWGDRVVAWCLDAETADSARALGWGRVVEASADAGWGALVAAMGRGDEGHRDR